MLANVKFNWWSFFNKGVLLKQVIHCRKCSLGFRFTREGVVAKQHGKVALLFFLCHWKLLRRSLADNYVRDRHLLLFKCWSQWTSVPGLLTLIWWALVLNGSDLVFVRWGCLLFNLVRSLETRLKCLSYWGIVSKLFACNRHEFLGFLNKQFFFIVVIIVQVRIKWDPFH